MEDEGTEGVFTPTPPTTSNVSAEKYHNMMKRATPCGLLKLEDEEPSLWLMFLLVWKSPPETWWLDARFSSISIFFKYTL